MKMRKLILFLLAGLFLSSSVIACIEPMAAYSSGVIFSKSECLNLGYFDSLGTDGTHFLRECKTNGSDSVAKDVIILTPEKDPLVWNDVFTIQNVSLTGSLLQIEVKYDGGCNPHEFVLYSNYMILESYPPILKLTLLHNANGDACKSLMTETLVFDLKPIEELHTGSMPLNIFINNINTGIKWHLENTCTIRYRSHYDPEVMVYLHFTEVNYTKLQVCPSMRIVTNPDVQYPDGFNYAKAIATELQWLTSNRIITGITDSAISGIEKKFDNQMGLFWTLQDTILAHNASYQLTIDTTGQWNWDKIVVQRKGCSEKVQFILPADSLKYEITPVKKSPARSSGRNIAIRTTDNRLFIDLSGNLLSPTQIEIIDLNGRLLHRVNVPVNQNSFVVQSPVKLGRGIYRMIFRSKEFTVTKVLIKTE